MQESHSKGSSLTGGAAARSMGVRDGHMNPVLVLTIAAVVLLALCGLSLWSGRTIGLYGVTELPTGPFYWIIVATYGALGGLCVLFAVRLMFH